MYNDQELELCLVVIVANFFLALCSAYVSLCPFLLRLAPHPVILFLFGLFIEDLAIDREICIDSLVAILSMIRTLATLTRLIPITNAW